ncbi:hypothetical protein L210DRAFT_944465 [Boletus edulis BED1]|uniref:Uncharacterized protein n=1 Tax=Boletus edulis BED1 TaxID=1328754 RepID=A0AAD4GB95_BOLED|nr:hypothetical protein L210DRAFT_944465 [Boletus edulis BED1]
MVVSKLYKYYVDKVLLAGRRRETAGFNDLARLESRGRAPPPWTVVHVLTAGTWVVIAFIIDLTAFPDPSCLRVFLRLFASEAA